MEPGVRDRSKNKLLADDGKLGSERSQLLKSHCSEILKKTKLLHGVSKEARKFELISAAPHRRRPDRRSRSGFETAGRSKRDRPERRPCHW